MKKSNFLWLIVLLLVCLLPAEPGLGQATTGNIVGTVMDPSMASIAGAQVTVASINTGTSRTVTTNEAGGYTVPGLLPAEYKITVTASGFKRVVVDNVTLRVDQELRRDVVMQVGEATQEITVTADTVAVGTENPALGTVIATKQVLEMPLNGRREGLATDRSRNQSKGLSAAIVISNSLSVISIVIVPATFVNGHSMRNRPRELSFITGSAPSTTVSLPSLIALNHNAAGFPAVLHR